MCVNRESIDAKIHMARYDMFVLLLLAQRSIHGKLQIFYTNTIFTTIDFTPEKCVSCLSNGFFSCKLQKCHNCPPKIRKITTIYSFQKTFRIYFTKATKILHKHCSHFHTFFHLWMDANKVSNYRGFELLI